MTGIADYGIGDLTTLLQVIVGILTSLGARASPHSALLGIAGPDVENGEGSPDIVLSAGVRRENAWRAIVKRATDLCSSMEILQVPSARNAQTLVAFVQMLMRAFLLLGLVSRTQSFLSRHKMTDSASDFSRDRSRRSEAEDGALLPADSDGHLSGHAALGLAPRGGPSDQGLRRTDALCASRFHLDGAEQAC